MLHPVDEVGPEALDLAVQVDVGHAVEQAVVHHADLHAGQVGAQAEVGAAAAEGHVVVGGPADVEPVGVGEHRLVPVGRDVPEHDLVPFGELLIADGHVGDGLAAEMHDGGHVSQHLLHGGGEERPVRPEALPLVRVVEEGHHGAGYEVPGRLVAGHRQQQEEEVELELGQAVAVHFGLGQDAEQVGVGVEAFVLAQLVGVGVELHCRLPGRLGGDLVFGIVGTDHPVGPVEHQMAVLLGHAHEVGDDLEG